jgi:hypothetical protein
VVLAAAVVLAASWSAALLGRADWNGWLVPVVLALGTVSAVLLVSSVRALWTWAAVAGLAAALLGPAAWTLQTVATPHTGSLPLAGPAVAAGLGGAGGGPGAGPGGGPGGAGGGFAGGPGGQAQPGGALPGPGTLPGGGTGAGVVPGTGGQPGTGGGTGTGGPAGMGGLLDTSTPSDDVVAALTEDASSFTWVAAAAGSQTAAGYQLATQLPVLAIGGFNGSDPYPTLAQFQQLVEQGRIHWFVGGGGFGGSNGGSSASSEITAWVTSTFEPVEVDGVTLYDLSSPAL